MNDAAAFNEEYERAREFAVSGDYRQALQLYRKLECSADGDRLQALVANDLGVLAAQRGDVPEALRNLNAALTAWRECDVARVNIQMLESWSDATVDVRTDQDVLSRARLGRRTKVAILSLLFNWPSTGGGTIHTAELAVFLGRAGYDVRHIFAEFPDWSIGNVRGNFWPCEAISFATSGWTVAEVQDRFRRAVDRFGPDIVIISDSWNFKPLLAEAMAGYRRVLRLAAMECLCPLNNIRLRIDSRGRAAGCPRHQLATPRACWSCVCGQGTQSGTLHQRERQLSGFGSNKYDRQLRLAFEEAESILVVNPLIAEMVKPYARQVRVVPSGFDASRFDITADESPSATRGKQIIFFAGLVEEFMKGFRVVHDACRLLWQLRRDFELVATGEPPGQVDAFTRFVGWLRQVDLPLHLRNADMLVFPTVAEESLGRSAVEAMGAGRPVIASRIGGLPFTVVDGLTGLLFEPGDPSDLADKIACLLDNSGLRREMGENARKRFETEFTWERVIDRHYRSLLGEPTRT